MGNPTHAGGSPLSSRHNPSCYAVGVRPPLLAILCLGCVEYGVVGTPAPLPETAPEVNVVPHSVELTGTCASDETSVSVENRGTSELRIEAATIEGEGWSLVGPSFPTTIEAGSAVDIVLEGSAGVAELVLTTNDSDEAQIRIPLSAESNRVPYVVIASPSESEVIAPESSLILEGFVSDADQNPDELAFIWLSDQIGEVSSGFPDENGRIVLEWPSSARVNGPQTIQLQVADRCESIGEASVYYCQDGAWPVNTLQQDAWRTEADAAVDQSAGTLQLGPNLGTGFDVFAIFDSDQVELEFRFRTEGGEGFALVALDSDQATVWRGDDGCGLGFGDCEGGTGLPGWALAFHLADDPEMALYADGQMNERLARASLPVVSDGEWHTAQIALSSTHLTVWIDGVETANMATVMPPAFGAFLGFTGTLGEYDFEAVSFVDSTCATP